MVRPLKIQGCDAVTFAPDGMRLACFANHVFIWDLGTRTKRLKCRPLANPAALCFSPAGERLALKNTFGRIVVIDSEDGSISSDFRNFHDGEGSNLLYSPCGEYLIDGTWDGRLFVRRADSGKVEFVQDFPGEMIVRVHRANKGATWVIRHAPRCLSDDGPAPPQYFSIWKWPFEKNSFDIFTQPSPFVRASALAEAGDFLALVYGTPPDTLAVYHLVEGGQVAHASIDIGGTGGALSWSCDTRYLGSVQKHRVKVYSVDGLREMLEYKLPYASDIAFSPRCDLLALGSWRSGVVLDIEESREIRGDR